MIFESVTIGKKLYVEDNQRSYSDENSRERPLTMIQGFSVKDGAHFENIAPRQGEEFSAMELQIDPLNFYPLNHNTFNIILCFCNKVPILGWVDEVEILSTAGNNIRIKWHPDWYLTILISPDGIVYGEGYIKRYDLAHARPDPSNPRSWVAATVTSIDHVVSTHGVVMLGPWAVMLYIDNSDNKTVFKTAAFCVREAGGTSGGRSAGIDFEFPEIYSGKCDEQMGLDPDKIIGCWITPIFPGFDTFDLKTFTYGSQNFGWFESSANVTKWWRVITGLDDYYTDDTRKICIVDPYDVVYATLPWGLRSTELYAKLDISTEGAYLLIYLKPIDNTDKIYAENRLISIPLISAAITSNAWSSYVYSGQREYDKITAKYQREQSLLSGVLGSGTSAIGGALAGSTAGMTGVGAVAGATMNIVGSIGNFFVSGHYDSKTQSAVDKLTANTAASCVVTGSGNAWTTKLGDTVASGETWKLVVMERDPVSKAELEAEHAELGYVTDFYCSDCNALIAAGGPMRIEGLKCKGISKEAQAYISAIFANGVKLE